MSAIIYIYIYKLNNQTLEGNDVRVYLCLHCIAVNNKIII
jgi:hypothetical protein